MASLHEKLATSLTALRNLDRRGRRVFESSELARLDRQRLVRNGFLQPVAKGWLISSAPGSRGGDSTPWYAAFWEFCARYSSARFGRKWCLAPEQSLLLHAENTVVPPEVVVQSPAGTNHKIALLFGTSLYDLKQPRMPPASDLTVRDGLRVFTPASALVRVPESFFAAHPIEARVVLAACLRDPSELLRRLLDGGHTVVAGRLAGAARGLGQPDAADEIITTMKAAGHDVRETDPLPGRPSEPALSSIASPIVGRMHAMWASMRPDVLAAFPRPPGRPKNRAAFLKSVEDIYQGDAYHSLSIEGYTVSVDLIERVRAGNWRPDRYEADRQSRDALAARGYWQAFQVVKGNIGKVIAGADPGRLMRTAHREWYRELFQPCVAAGIIPPGALAGYRNDAVYLRASRYVPPRWEAVRDAMPALFDLLEHEPEPAVRAVLGHWMFGYVHPYPDGNGRIARFLMNAMLASGGLPWTIIRVDDRDAYLGALDRASVDLDIAPFAKFIAQRVRRSMRRGAAAETPRKNSRR